MTSPSAAWKRHRTQWSTQFLAAAELVRRGYTVSFTMGNCTPDADLMVGTPGGDLFWVDVKGQSGKAPWLIRTKRSNEKLFYVLVLLAPAATPERGRQPDRFFVLTQSEADECIADYLRRHPGDSGKLTGFPFGDAVQFEDAWGKLPNSVAG